METKKPLQNPIKGIAHHPYIVGLINANLMQTDFAGIERRQWLRSMQLRMGAEESSRGWLRERAALYCALYQAFKEHGPLHGLRPVFTILQRDAEALL